MSHTSFDVDGDTNHIRRNPMTILNPLRAVVASVTAALSLVDRFIQQGISGARKTFSRRRDNLFLPTVYVKLSELKVDSKYQRLINTNFIKKAKEFDPYLVKPLSVFKRPNGDLMVVDGQHTCVLAGIYVNDPANFELPCQIQTHPAEFSVKDCEVAEANYFKRFNSLRNIVSAVAKLRADLAQRAKYALQLESNFISLGIHVERIGANDDGANGVKGYNQLRWAIGKYDLTYTGRAIAFYKRLNASKTFKGWNTLNGGTILGLTALFHFIDTYVGEGQKRNDLMDYLNKHLGKLSENVVTKKTVGIQQDILIVQTILERYATAATILGYIPIGMERDNSLFTQWVNDKIHNKNELESDSEES